MQGARQAGNGAFPAAKADRNPGRKKLQKKLRSGPGKPAQTDKYIGDRNKIRSDHAQRRWRLRRCWGRDDRCIDNTDDIRSDGVKRNLVQRFKFLLAA